MILKLQAHFRVSSEHNGKRTLATLFTRARGMKNKGGRAAVWSGLASPWLRMKKRGLP